MDFNRGRSLHFYRVNAFLSATDYNSSEIVDKVDAIMFHSSLSWHLILLIGATGLYAGAQNVLAGGGSFITFPALMLAGLNPLAANLTSQSSHLERDWWHRGRLPAALYARHVFRETGAVVDSICDGCFCMGQLQKQAARRSWFAGGMAADVDSRRDIDLWRLFWRRHRILDAGGIDRRRSAGARGNGDKECLGDGDERVGCGDFRVFQPGRLGRRGGAWCWCCCRELCWIVDVELVTGKNSARFCGGSWVRLDGVDVCTLTLGCFLA